MNNDSETAAQSSHQSEEADVMKDLEASTNTNSSDSSPKGARIVAMERKMDQMSKELQLLQKEKAEIKAENQRLRQRVDDIQLGQHKGPQAVLIADTHVAIPDETNKSAPSTPRNGSNKKLVAAIACILLLAGAIAGGVSAALLKKNNNKESSTITDTATSPTGSPTLSATAVPTSEATTTLHDPSVLVKNSLVVDQVQDNGKSFFVPLREFPLYIDSSPENPSNRTTIRMWNSRTDTIKGVMLEVLANDDEPSTTGIARSSSSSNRNQVVRGYYNPQEFTQPNDFAPGDELVAVDYRPLLVDGPCTRQDFGILAVSDELGWNVDPGNIRIGRLGVVGAWYADFEYTFELNQPVAALWTDAVGIEIEYISRSSFGYQPLVPREGRGPIRMFPNGPVSGTIKIKFKGASFTNLNGLVTHRDAGGLHVAFCADRSDGGSVTRPPRTVAPTFSPTFPSDRYMILTSALLAHGVYYRDTTAFEWLTNTDTWVAATDSELVERYALAVFFQYANGNNWSKNTNWKAPGIGVCSWEGVGCRSTTVVELDLINVGLSGTIATELGLLSNLSRIRTQNDNIAEDGKIPFAFTQLPNLKLLFMRNCGVNKISEEILGMTNLSELLLRENRFSSSIPSEIFSLTKLTSLNLKECSLRGQIPEEISQLTDLEVLDVSVNNLRAPFPEGLTRLPNLRRFVAGQNPWSTTIPSWFGQLTKLQQLFLAFSNMQGSLPSEILQMTSLTFLTLNVNQFTGSIPPLPATLTDCNLNSNLFADTTNRGPCSV